MGGGERQAERSEHADCGRHTEISVSQKRTSIAVGSTQSQCRLIFLAKVVLRDHPQNAQLPSYPKDGVSVFESMQKHMGTRRERLRADWSFRVPHIPNTYQKKYAEFHEAGGCSLAKTRLPSYMGERTGSGRSEATTAGASAFHQAFEAAAGPPCPAAKRDLLSRYVRQGHGV